MCAFKGLFTEFSKFHSKFLWVWGYLMYRSHVKWGPSKFQNSKVDSNWCIKVLYKKSSHI